MATYGQSDAIAVELVTALNNYTSNFCLTVSCEHKYKRKIGFGDVSVIGEDVTVEIVPGDEISDRTGINAVYDDIYGCHIVIMQNVNDTTSGGLSETRMRDLLRLRSEIIEYLCGSLLDCPDAVHPFENAHIIAVRHGKEGVYDLEKLEQNNIFYSDIILTYKVVGLKRTNV